MKLTQRMLALVLILMMALSVIGCSTTGTTQPEPSAAAPSDAGTAEPAAPAPETEGPVKKVAMLMSGPINDGGWNTDAYNGLLEIEKDLGCEIAYSENVAASDIETLLRQYADNGYGLIFGQGYEYCTPMKDICEEYPDVMFFSNCGTETAANLGGSELKYYELGYLTGVLAAKLTKANKIGFVGAMETPAILAEVRAFKGAVKELLPEASVTENYTGSWSDVTLGYEAGKSMISQGCDVIMGIGDACDVGAIQACEESNGACVFIGFATDLNYVSPEIVVTSGVQSSAMIFKDITEKYLAGKFPGGEITVYSVANGGQYMGAWCTWIDEGIKAEILDLEAQIKAGTLVPNYAA